MKNKIKELENLISQFDNVKYEVVEEDKEKELLKLRIYLEKKKND